MYKKMKDYRDIRFSDETRHGDFYIYADVKDLPATCEQDKDRIIKCRTVGILQSQYGHYYLYDLDSTGVQTEHRIKASTVYMKSPAQSAVLPYPVQVFGTLQWSDNMPVIFINFLQVISAPTAIRYKSILSSLAKQHLPEIEINFDPIEPEEKG